HLGIPRTRDRGQDGPMPPTPSVIGRRSLVRLALGVVLALSSFGLSAAGAHAAATPTICPGRFGFARAGTVLAIPVCSNRPLESIPAGTVHRVIVVIHGDSRRSEERRV